MVLMLSFVAVTALKLLLVYSYYSTDFFVHKNWLATTYRLSINDWYRANHSQWTLDYPPLFAYFEYGMAVASVALLPQNVSRELLEIRREPKYAISDAVRIWHRVTVQLSDLLMLLACSRLANVPAIRNRRRTRIAIALLLLANLGLLLLDHIHFQYNGFLFALLIWSIAESLQNNHLKSAMLYAILINCKHLFVGMAPAVAIHLLQSYCKNIRKFTQLALVTATVFGVSFVPFYSQLNVVFRQLFPFERGLCHAYWAPNFWPLYIVADKLLAIIGKRLQISESNVTGSSMTDGQTKTYTFQVLPQIEPIHCAVIVLITLMPAIVRQIHDRKHFIDSLALSAFVTFYFGWHVHEKAALTFLVPLTITLLLPSANEHRKQSRLRTYQIASLAAIYSFLPLLYETSLAPLKFVLFAAHFVLVRHVLPHLVCDRLPKRNSRFDCYSYGFFVLFVLDFLHGLDDKHRFPFLPLLFTSCYCSSGLLWSFYRFYRSIY